MVSLVTNDILVKATVTYLDSHSRPEKNLHFFTYEITVENRSEYNVQLVSRYWYITDSGSGPREIRGPGVVGEQPILLPSESYTYRSACDFRGQIGEMTGYYTFKNLDTGHIFDVKIPAFQCQADYILN